MHTEGKSEKKKGTPKPPDGGWGWWVVFGSFMIHVIADGVAYTFGIFFPSISTEFVASKQATSWITSIMAGITYSSGPIAGALVNKFGCRFTSVLGSFVAAFGFAISYYAQSVVSLYVSIGLIGGLGMGLIYLPAIVSVTSYFEKRRAFATGIAVCGSGFGTAVLAPLIGELVKHFDWRFALVITGSIIFSCVIFSLLFKPLPESPEVEDEEEEEDPRFPSVLRPEVEKPLIKSPTGSDYPGSPQSAVEPMEKQSFPIQYLKLAHNETLTMSCSQPALRATIGSTDSLHSIDPSRKRHSLRASSFAKDFDHNQNSSHTSAGLIVQRKDIFYSGSLLKIPSAGVPKTSLNGSMDHINMKPLRGDDTQEKKRCCRCLPCPAEVKEAFNSMTDFSILKDPIFLFFAISNFFTSIGYNIPYTFLYDLAIKDPDNPQHSKEDSSLLLSIVGIANTLSRVILGYLSDKEWVNRLYLYNIALAICGLAIGVTPHVTGDLNALRVCSGVFGATVGVYVSLTSVILVDLLGLEKLTNAFGLLLVFQGVATVVGPPIVGVMHDVFGTHVIGWGVAGTTLALSGLMLFLIPVIQKRRAKEETDSSGTEQQTLSSASQQLAVCVEITGSSPVKEKSILCPNGTCNDSVKNINNNINSV